MSEKIVINIENLVSDIQTQADATPFSISDVNEALLDTINKVSAKPRKKWYQFWKK